MLSEQGKLIRAPQALGMLGTDLFGDKANFYNGSLEFVQTDVSLPGDNSLPVAVGRRLVVGDVNQSNHELMQWALNIPRIHGTFSNQYGWAGLDANGSASPLRCTYFGKPRNISYTFADFLWFEYWHGNFPYIPGVGDQEIRKRNPANGNIPADGSTRLQIYSPAGQLLFATQTASSTGPASRTWYIYLHHGLIAEVKQ